jgi:glycosyltransferase involved in cell wall biosynthesis
MEKKVIFIQTHPIQYASPLFRYLSLNKLKNYSLEVWYLENFKEGPNFDKEFNKEITWDIPLLEGFDYKYINNLSNKSLSFKGFFDFINIDIIKNIKKIPDGSLIIVHGWNYFTLWLIFFYKIYFKKNIHLLLRSESQIESSRLKNNFLKTIKSIILKNLFKKINGFLFIGSNNFSFYRSFGIDYSKLHFFPYTVDNKKFIYQYKLMLPHSNDIKNLLGIDKSKKIIIYSGKLIPKKRPLDLIKVMSKQSLNDYFTIIVGDGELKNEMEQEITNLKLNNIKIFGFINQSTIGLYYTIADIFIMLSDYDETWGLSANEALNFGCKLVLSNRVGCSPDLVTINTGRIFKYSDIDDIEKSIIECSLIDEFKYNEDRIRLLEKYSYKTNSLNLNKLILNNIN